MGKLSILVNDRLGSHVFYKLSDFGIARTLEHRAVNMSSKGTPNYMAPEVTMGKPYDARADIYSLGLTLYDGKQYQQPGRPAAARGTGGKAGGHRGNGAVPLFRQGRVYHRREHLY